MNRALAVTISALLLLMSYGSVVQSTTLREDKVSHTESVSNPWPFEYATSMGAIGTVSIFGIVEDEEGNLYVNGHYYASSTPSGFSDFLFPNNTRQGNQAFVAKYSYENGWQWVRVVSNNGSNIDSMSRTNLVMDSEGSLYFTGKIELTWYYCHYFGSIQFCGNNDNNLERMFVAKLDADGNWMWANTYSYFDGYEHLEYATDIFIDGNDYIYMTGYSFLMLKIDSSGNQIDVEYAPTTSPSHKVHGNAIAADDVGNVVISSSNQISNSSSYTLWIGETYSTDVTCRAIDGKEHHLDRSTDGE